MSGMLASVCNLEETQLVQDAGVDIIDLKNPNEGALGALDLPVIEKIVAHVNGLTPVSATIGDLPFDAPVIEPVIKRMALTGVDIIKVGVFGKTDDSEQSQMLSILSQQGIRIVLVIFAEHYNQGCNFKNLALSGITGIMLDTMQKNTGSLREKLSDPLLQDFVTQTRKHGLLSGLAGSLSVRDIAPLREINPDYLGFRGGLCQQGQRANTLDQQAIKNIRRLIPLGCQNFVQTAAIIQVSNQG